MDFALVLGLTITGLVIIGAGIAVAMLGSFFSWLAKIADANDDE